MIAVDFTKLAYAQYLEFKKFDKKNFARIEKLLESIQHTPFEGLGKPEPLKHNLAGCWSRRINKEHRLVYQVTSDSVIVISCKYHY